MPMRAYESRNELLDAFGKYGSADVKARTVSIRDATGLRRDLIDNLAYTAVFGADEPRAVARWLIWETAQQLGCRPASIHDFYIAGGRGMWNNQTTPAINVRALAYDTARTIFRSAQKLDVGQVIFEIARSEMGYTNQRPEEYASSVLAAAIREGHQGPVFIQGDHFQINAKGYKADGEKEVQGVRDLIDEALAAGFYNIDVDTSTIVDLSLDGEDAQQADNAFRSAQLTAYIREHQPKDITVSVGAEIGEVGTENSTVAELHAFMRAYQRELAGMNGGSLTGISKISVQTGTSHGGIVLPDGSIAKVKVDFDTLGELSSVARSDYHLGGAVQHGASTLPEEAFDRFAQANACEVHLATAFQNIVYDSEAFPDDLRNEIYAYLEEHHQNERKPDMTDAQFYYTARKRGIGPFKQQMWDLPDDARGQIMSELGSRFELIFSRLGVTNTMSMIRDITPTPSLPYRQGKAISDVEVEGE
ncbi:MAG TPA: class II fructose-bisphosphate aldolase [Thermomicrobiales bacterium]|nr:class II fructose-bisphosphate aldolase [Thermomicrobiales bacterium]